MSVEAYFKLSGCVIRQNTGHWCQKGLVMCPSLVFLPPLCAVCGVVTVISPRSCDGKHHGIVTATAGSYRHLLENLLAPAKHRLCVLQNILPARHISRYGRCDLRTCSLFPEAMKHCHRQFHSCRRQCLSFPAGQMYCL
jgi:hypothetical protein